MQVGRCGRKRRPVCNGLDRGSNFAPRRKAADFLRVSHGENTEQIVNRGSVYKGSPRATGVLGPGNRYGPCAELSSRSYDRALSGACVRLERRAVKVACVVLRGLGGREPTWLPGDSALAL